MIRIVDGLYMLESGGFVNAYLIEGSSDLTLVDSGHSRSARGLVAELKSNGFSVRDIGRVLVTHAHADHVGAIAHLLSLHPVKVYAHPEEIAVLQGRKTPYPFRGVKGFCMEFFHEQWLPWAPVDAVFPLEPSHPLRGMAHWQVIHAPGHTSGSLAFYNPAKQVLISGDAIVNRKGRLKMPEACTNYDQAVLKKTVQSLAALDTDILCPGHGRVLRGGAFRYIEALSARRRTH